MATRSFAHSAPADGTTYTICYDPPAFGEIISADACRHDPAGHLIDLGCSVDFDAKGGDKIIISGHICLKCGAGSHVEADDWWDLWHIALAELSAKSWKFTKRLYELAEAAGGLPRPKGLPHCRSQSRARSAVKRRYCRKVRFTDGREAYVGPCGQREFRRLSLRFTRSSLPYLPARRGLPSTRSRRAA